MASLPTCSASCSLPSQVDFGRASAVFALRTGCWARPSRGHGGRRLRSLRIVMLDKKSGESDGGDSAESLFMRELRRRGLTDSSAPPDSKASSSSSSPTSVSSQESAQDGARESTRGSRLQGLEPPPITGETSQPQIAKSRALASEGLDGLPVRAWELLKLGGGFSLGFAPLVLGSIALFVAAYLYFGEGFVHPGSKYTGSQPTYVDPYQLLEDDYYQQKALGL